MELLAKSIFDGMKMAQYQDIPIVKDMECPDCHKSDVGGFFHERAKPIGWCDTQTGFMGVFECPHCFSKFRCHISTTGRYNEDTFYSDFALVHYMYNEPNDKSLNEKK